MGWPEYGRIHAFHNNHTMVQHQKMYFFFFTRNENQSPG